MNKVILIGRLTKDPELTYIPVSGTATCKVTLAVDRRAAKDGQREADFISVVVWGKPAENTATYMAKGRLMGVSGRLQVRSYEDKGGNKRYVTEVVADEVQFLGSSNNSAAKSALNSFDGMNYDDEMQPIDDGDIPF